MEVDINPRIEPETPLNIDVIINSLIGNENAHFKNQQRDEADLNDEEKRKIASDVFQKSKTLFLSRYGKFIKREHLGYFDQYADKEDYEMKVILGNLRRSERGQNLTTKNRRYEALKKLVGEKTYFSDLEMMKRNPLLYEQLVGQYLTKDEKRERDRNAQNDTLVKILMEGIERDQADAKKRLQEEEESNAMEEEDSDEESPETNDEMEPCTSRWGEFTTTPQLQRRQKKSRVLITAQERQLLKDEFTSIMYQSFLEGKDDFDYATVDNNDEYDNIDILEHDEEDKYFDSEEPDDEKMDETEVKTESSEDELDIYMSALNQHPAVCKLSEDLKKL